MAHDHRQLSAFFKAGTFAGMASRSHLVNFYQNGISIAIQREGLHILGIDQNVTRPVVRVRLMASSFI